MIVTRCVVIRGGGIYILYNHLFPIVVNTEFNANTATAGSGGGLYLRTMNTGLVLDHVSVVGNMASVDGGGVALSMANVAIIFQSSTLKGNVAETGSGGGLSLTTGESFGSTAHYISFFTKKFVYYLQLYRM